MDKRSAVKIMLSACEGLEDLEDCINAAYDSLQQTDLLQEAIKMLELQRNRTYYKQDEQIENAKQVKEFIERHKK